MGFCNTDDSVILKLCLGQEIRRVSSLLSSYSSLCDLVLSLFGISLLPSQNFLFTYQDDTNETVTMSSDIELAEAKRITAALPTKVLRLNVQTKTATTKENKQPKNQNIPVLDLARDNCIEYKYASPRTFVSPRSQFDDSNDCFSAYEEYRRAIRKERRRMAI